MPPLLAAPPELDVPPEALPPVLVLPPVCDGGVTAVPPLEQAPAVKVSEENRTRNERIICIVDSG
jgi:hypothetical protein